MEWIRVTAKTVDEAITEAAITLGTSSDNMEYNIIEKGSSGFFGIGAKKAVIEARKKKSDEELMREVFGDDNSAKPKKEHKNKDPKPAKKEKSPEGKKEVKEFSEGKKAEKAEKADKAEKAEKKQAPEKAKDGAKKHEKSEKPEKSQKAEKPAKSDKGEKAEKPAKAARTEKKPVNAESADEQAEKAVVKEAAEEKKEKTPREPADPEVAKQRGESFLKEVFRTMGMNVEVSSSFEEDTLSVDISGDDMGLLIGKRGQTLDSLQYLTSLVVNKGNAAYVRVKLDTEDYRSRRKATLENLAKNIASKVRKSGKPIFLEPMNPYERRIIHSALQNDPYVTTHSEGEEPCRKVVVTLKKGVEPYDKDKERGGRRGSRGDRYSRRDRDRGERRKSFRENDHEEEDVLKNIQNFVEMPDVTGEGEIKTFD